MDGKVVLVGLASLTALVVGMKRLSAKEFTEADSVYDPNTYPKSIRDWQAATRRKNLKGASFLGVVSGNGARDSEHVHGRRSTLIFIPSTFRENAPWNLVYLFHGLGGFKLGDGRAQGAYDPDWTANSILKAEAKGANLIFVMPEMPWSANTSDPKGRQRFVFNGRGEENFDRWDQEVRAILRRRFGITRAPAKTTFIGHSAGGSTLRAISSTGGMDRVKPDLVIWSDAAYGTWLDEFYRNFRDPSRTKVVMFNLLANSPTKPYKQTERFVQSAGKPSSLSIRVFTYGDGWSHRKIGYNAVPLSLDY